MSGSWRDKLAAQTEAKKQAKGTKSKAQEMKEANEASMAKVEANAIPGACKYLGTLKVSGTSYPVYADSHQGKHVSGYWENGPKQEESCFYESIVSWKNAAMLLQFATNVPWGTVATSTNGGDFCFRCSRGVGLTDDGAEVDWVWVQGGFQTRYGIRHISFHAVPITEAETKGTAWTVCSDLAMT